MSSEIARQPDRASPHPKARGPSTPRLDPKDTALFLDFDGTLVDIADTPDGIDVPSDLSEMLNALRDRLNGRLALVSGRTVSDLSTYVSDFSGPIYGSHGGELAVDGEVIPLSVASDELDQMTSAADTFCAEREGLALERKPLGFAIHFRSNPDLEGDVRLFMENRVAETEGVKLQPAKMAFEIKPDTVGKDIAIEDAIERFGWRGRDLWMIGDDVTDEAGFRVVNTLGGGSIKVGEGDTVATHRMASPQEVLHFLRMFGEQDEDE